MAPKPVAPPGSPSNPGFLDRMRRTADPKADDLLGAIFARRETALINTLLQTLDGNSEALPPGLPPDVVAYLRSVQMPPWADKARIARAQRLFLRHGAVFGLALMLSSLPSLYAGAFGGAQILAMTGQLTRNFRRRASETLRFILDTMVPGGLDEGGKGVRSIQKVRMMHASIRQYALHGAAWKEHPEWGAPINQEELAGTLMAFSVVALEGLEKLGIKVSRADKEDYLHAWTCIGYVLGIDPAALPADLREGEKLWKAVCKRNFRPTPEALQLMAAHLEFVKEMLPGHTADGLVESLMRYLMGKRIACDILGLPKASWTDWLIGWIRAILLLDRLWIFKGRGMNALLRTISEELMESLQAYWSDGGPPPFRIPTSVAGAQGPG